MSALDGLKVAIASQFPESEAGGIERFCHLLATGLQSRGVEASVTAWPVPSAQWDLVITNGMLGGPAKAPRIHVYHGSWVGHQFWGDPLSPRHRRLRIGLRGAQREIHAGRGATRVAVSGSAAREIRRFYRLPVHHIVPNGVDTDLFQPIPRSEARRRLGWPEGQRIALFAGRPETRKQPELAVEAAHRAGLVLWSAGSSAAPGADRYIGVLSPPEMALAFAAAECALIPSLYEACSLTVLEALAAGAPLATSRVGWVPDLLEIAPSLLQLTAPRSDDEAFCVAVENAVAHPEAADDAAKYVRRRLNLQAWADAWCGVVMDTLTQDDPLQSTPRA